MDDREFVERHWEHTHCCDGSYKGYPRGTVLLMEANHQHVVCMDWAAAAEFTRNRLEEIRQLEREMGLIGKYADNRRDILSKPFEPLLGTREDIADHLRLLESVLIRLQSSLSDLKRGMKEQ